MNRPAFPCRALAAAVLGLSLGLAAAFPAAGRTDPPPAPLRIVLTPAEPQAGDAVLVELECRTGSSCPSDVRLSWAEQEILLFPHPLRGPSFRAGLLAIPLSARPEEAVLEAAWTQPGGRRGWRFPFRIRPGFFAEEALRVDPRHVRPSPRDLERIRREREELERIYASGARRPLWEGGFSAPVPGEISGAFGTRRVFNGELISRHTGVDFRAASGDPVVAAGSGVVRLGKELFYSGNAVVIDHGAGIFTSYSHLSRIEVTPGRRLARDEILGRVGATGRATGPHLHWGVKLNGVSVNPIAFLAAAARLGGS
ncbi:MAG: M23 family metallopeptidase [Desulfobacterales bacterium]